MTFMGAEWAEITQKDGASSRRTGGILRVHCALLNCVSTYFAVRRNFGVVKFCRRDAPTENFSGNNCHARHFPERITAT